MLAMKCVPRFLIATFVLCALGMTNSAAAQSDFNVDSFFDVYTELMVNGDVSFQSTGNTIYEGISTEMVSLSLTSSRNRTVDVIPNPADGTFIIDSFFDIAYSTDPDGSGNAGGFSGDSFFDIVTKIKFTPNTATSTESRGEFDTEILSMDLSGVEPTTLPFVGVPELLQDLVCCRGHVTVLKTSESEGLGDTYNIDSFFDVFTAVSFDGDNFIPATADTRIAFASEVRPGDLQSNPVLPSGVRPEGGWGFDDVPGDGNWFDPPMASGYVYETDGASNFVAVVLPAGIDADGEYTVTDSSGTTTVIAGAQYTFPTATTQFTVGGIDPLVDGGDPTAFPAFISFDQSLVSFTQTPVPEPTSLVLSLLGAVGLAAGYRRRRR